MGDRPERSDGGAGKRPRRFPGTAKRLLFSLIALALFFGLLELLLWAAGTDTLLSWRDPFAGFSEQVRVYEKDAQHGVYRTARRATRHSFNPQEFLADKPENGFRIFVLGGSSAYGFPWGAGAAFPRALGDALQASRPERRVEAVNAAAMSYGSHRLRILTRELLEYEPDLLIVYSGHNEFVERRFYRELLERPEELDRLRKLLYRWRLFSLLTRAGERLGRDRGDAGESAEGGGGSAGGLLGLDVSREYSVNVGDREVAEVRALFEENLRAILEMADRAGVPVLLCTVPSNVRNWLPNQSLFDAAVTFEQQQEVLTLLAEAGTALEQGDAAAAAERLERASGLAPNHAESWYRLGQAYEALGRRDDARASYVRARDTDAQPGRAVSALNETLRALAAERGTWFLDVERVFEETSPDGLIGFNLIEDYVHPKPEGHRLIALELWKILEESGLLGEARPADPERFYEAVGRAPGDPSADPNAPTAAAGAETPSLLFNLAVVLENQGLLDQAMEKYRACIELDPTHAVARTNLGRLLNRQERFVEAMREFSRALEVKPDHVAAMVGLGEALRMQGRLAEALEWFTRATATDPGSAPAWNRLGVALSQQNRYEEAEAALRRSVDLDPSNAGHQVDLGFTLLFLGKQDAAESAFRAGLGLRADDARARNGLAAVLTEKGRLDEAERLFRQSLQADPRDPFARQGLAEIEQRRAAGR